MYFRIPELGNRKIEANEVLSPIVVMTNNSEKSLPDAFLRRCIYYNIPFPTAERLEDIVIARLPAFAEADAIMSCDAIDFLLFIRRDSVSLEKRPGTAELLNWLSAMIQLGGNAATPLGQQLDVAIRAAGAIAKTSNDQNRIGDLLRSWNGSRGT